MTPIERPAAPLGPGDVWLDSSGNVHLAPGVCPTVGDLGGLLELLLTEIRRKSVGRIPPGLLIITARATGKIDDAPVPSAGALARALERFDPPHPDAALRALFEAATVAPSIEELPAANVEIHAALPTAALAIITQQRKTRRYVATACVAVGGFAAGVMVAFMFQAEGDAPHPVDTTEVTIARPRTGENQPRPAATNSPETRERMRTVSSSRPPVVGGMKSAAEPLIEPAAVNADGAFSPSFDSPGTAVFFHAQSGNSSASSAQNATNVACSTW